ncbi:arginine transporter 1-like isoform X2 [Hylaeus volcanicus]|uniref:arginine transporter 1-like isoform X2 n=1 Tax=Hylaeus volcanicus TaxID=313075 RepID=UPI0023B78EC2|nr:arginine transporter 1-like isoform X2 [Hylaeus volcanicus]
MNVEIENSKVANTSDLNCLKNSRGIINYNSTFSFIEKIKQNRWLCSVVCCVTVFCCATPYNNWDGFAELLYRDGVYRWHCTSDELTRSEICKVQRRKIEQLFYFASGAEYSVGVIAGFLFDFWGPRYCGLTGMCILFLGLLALIVSSQSLPLYILSLVLMGSSTNIVGFPGLIVGNLFPSHKSHALTLLMACQLGSSFIPVSMRLFWKKFMPKKSLSTIFILYTCFIFSPCAIAYYLFLPGYRFARSLSQNSEHSTIVVDDQVNKNEALHDLKKRTLDRSIEIQHDKKTSISLQEGSEFLKSIISEDEEKLEKDILTVSFKKKTMPFELKGSLSQLKQELLTWDIHIFTIYYILQVIQFLYFPNTIERIYGRETLSIAGYIALFQVFFGVGVAFIVNYTGTLMLCGILVLINFIIYFSVLINSKYYIFLILLNNLGYSFIFTSKITFLSDTYKENNIGQLVGYVSLTAGCVTILMGFLSSILEYVAWAGIFLVLSCLCLLLLFILWCRASTRVKF